MECDAAADADGYCPRTASQRRTAEAINAIRYLVMLDRQDSGRNANPMAGVLDSQSVKPPYAAQGDYDA